MRRSFSLAALAAAALLGLGTAGCYIRGPGGQMGIHGGVGISFPVTVVGDPDEVWLIPRFGVYFVPNISADVFFFRGHWYSRNRGGWFRGDSHRGPWTVLPYESVPPTVRGLPDDYRKSYKYKRVPYGQWKQRGYTWDEREDD